MEQIVVQVLFEVVNQQSFWPLPYHPCNLLEFLNILLRWLASLLQVVYLHLSPLAWDSSSNLALKSSKKMSVFLSSSTSSSWRLVTHSAVSPPGWLPLHSPSPHYLGSQEHSGPDESTPGSERMKAYPGPIKSSSLQWLVCGERRRRCPMSLTPTVAG